MSEKFGPQGPGKWSPARGADWKVGDYCHGIPWALAVPGDTSFMVGRVTAVDEPNLLRPVQAIFPDINEDFPGSGPWWVLGCDLRRWWPEGETPPDPSKINDELDRNAIGDDTVQFGPGRDVAVVAGVGSMIGRRVQGFTMYAPGVVFADCGGFVPSDRMLLVRHSGGVLPRQLKWRRASDLAVEVSQPKAQPSADARRADAAEKRIEKLLDLLGFAYGLLNVNVEYCDEEPYENCKRRREMQEELNR